MKAIRIWQLSLALAALSCAVAFLSLLPATRLILAGAGAGSLREQIIAWSCGASAINSGILLFLLALCPWWAGKKVDEARIQPEGRQAGRWFWPVVFGAALAMITMTLPRLGQSLWDDEETSLRFSILGRYLRVQPDGQPKFHQASWLETLFYYKQPNNHVLHNILSRVSNSTWRAMNRPSGLQFREEAVRLPAFVAGIAGIFTLGLLLRAMGYPNAGMVAAWLLAFHPWYQRYACEARGYSLVMALLPVAALVWREALRTGRWRWWSAFALVQFALVWTYPAVLFVLVPLNFATPWFLLKGRNVAKPPTVSTGRWFCCQSLAAVAALQVVAPLLPQAREYFRPLDFSPIDLRWLADYLGYLGAGLPWATTDPGQGPAHPCLEQIVAVSPGAWLALFGAALVLAALGVFAIAKRSDTAWKIVFCSALLGPLLQVAYAAWQQVTFWEWYLLHVLPWTVALVSIGIDRLSALTSSFPPAFRIAPATVAVFAIASYALMTEPVRQWQSPRPITPTRDAVLSTRPNLDPDDPENRRIMTAGLTNPPACYDANVFFLKDLGELVLLCRMADLSGRPLWLNIGHLWALRSDHPDAYRMVSDRRLFDAAKVLRGHSAMGDRMVCRYIPNSMDRKKAGEYITPEDEMFIGRNLEKTPEEYFSGNF